MSRLETGIEIERAFSSIGIIAILAIGILPIVGTGGPAPSVP